MRSSSSRIALSLIACFTSAFAARSASAQGQPADLTIPSISAPLVGLAGDLHVLTFSLQNTGGSAANAFFYEVGLQPVGDPFATVLVSGPHSLPAGGMSTHTATATLPNTPLGAYEWVVVVDSTSAVPESSEGNNIARFEFQVMAPAPDLTVLIAEASTVAAGGEALSITRTVSNLGPIASGSFTLGYYLSTDPDITTADFEIGTSSGSLLGHENSGGIETLVLPTTITSGVYWLGAIIDPADAIAELDETNNVALGPQITVFGADFRIVTDTLPNGVIGVPYEVQLFEVGARAPVVWILSAGTLPTGLMLDSSGVIDGVPTEEGVTSFIVRATSGADEDQAALSIRVAQQANRVTLGNTTLVGAIVGRSYTHVFTVTGGQPPYQWSVEGTLPDGMALSSDGTFAGTPVDVGRTSFTVVVADRSGRQDSAVVTFVAVGLNDQPRIVPNPPPPGEVGQDYCKDGPVRFEVAGGLEPFEWSLQDAAPPGLSLAVDGTLCGTPTEVGRFGFVVRVTDSLGMADTSGFTVEVVAGNRLEITPAMLPNALVGAPFAAQLSVTGGVAPYDFGIVQGDLPPGIIMDNRGALAGTPTQVGLYTFAVRATDAQGATRDAARSIDVRSPGDLEEVDDAGCGCHATHGSGASWGIVVLGLALLIRRRR